METNAEDRLFGMLIYVLSFFAPILAPLIIWLIKKDSSRFIDYHGREYFNFMISYAIYGIISGILIIVAIGFILIPIVGIALFVLTIVAAVKAYQGEYYKIPLIIRFF